MFLRFSNQKVDMDRENWAEQYTFFLTQVWSWSRRQACEAGSRRSKYLPFRHKVSLVYIQSFTHCRIFKWDGDRNLRCSISASFSLTERRTSFLSACPTTYSCFLGWEGASAPCGTSWHNLCDSMCKFTHKSFHLPTGLVITFPYVF